MKSNCRTLSAWAAAALALTAILTPTVQASGVATTYPATVVPGGVTMNGAGYLAAGGSPTEIGLTFFEYGLTTSYGVSWAGTPVAVLPGQALSVFASLNLPPGITYHFRFKVIGNAPNFYGSDMMFTTLVVAPTVTTLAASGITAANASLNGMVNPNGGATTTWFQYGTATTYGSFSATNTLAAANTGLNVTQLIAGLSPATVYHYRSVATNSAGITYGSDQSFTTSVAQPVNFSLSGTSRVVGGALQFGFSNVSGVGFTVLGTTNVAWPINAWSNLGPAVETPPGSGQFRVTDPGATNSLQRFYRVRSP